MPADKLTFLAQNQYGNFYRAAFRSHLSQFLVDRDGFFAAKLKQVRQRMRELGTRRVYFEDGCWYWELKPGMQPGEVVEL